MGNDTERLHILLHQQDNTITALVDLARGVETAIESETDSTRITLKQDIPYAHKFARSQIPKGADVIKYGEVIGVASAEIQPGDHVHVHNVESKRARGE
jgi:altronate dehydratase small subunit